MGNEREQDGWLGNALRQAPSMPSDSCLDAETLAAWADGGLSAKAAAAVELHASSCSRCMAVLAAMERSAPAPSATHAWTPARLFRWVAPLAAAATAVAIWVAIPDRPITPVEPAPAHDLAAPVPGPGTRNPESETGNLEPRSQPAPSARLEKPAAEEQLPLRDEVSRERAAPQALGAAAGTAVPEAPPPAAAPDSLAETVTMAQQRSNFAGTIVVTSESIAAANQLFRWRVIGNVSIERSTDGGKTWTKTMPIPGVEPNKPSALTIRRIRAISDVSAIVTTSDGRDFYTSNGGVAWIPPVQEKPAAPF